MTPDVLCTVVVVSRLRRARSSRSAGLRAASLRSMHNGLGDDERGSGSSRMRRNSIKSNASKASSVYVLWAAVVARAGAQR